MRIWDIPPKKLCRSHLLGEHRELHAIWSVITKNKRGYNHHPETQRWRGKLNALYLRHEKLVKEMEVRGYNHHSILEKELAKGSTKQNVFVDSIEDQFKILKEKRCHCKVDTNI
jgi:hypothetical protein